MEKRNFNEALKQREAREREELKNRTDGVEKTLDDATRVKVLSPGMMVFKRFIRNKLAILGSAILITMFLFAFLGPYFYQYGQTQVFSTYKPLNVDYASAIERVDHTVYNVNTDLDISTTTKNMFNSLIGDMEAGALDATVLKDEKTGATVIVERLGENIYTMGTADASTVGSYELGESLGKYSTKMKKVMYTGEAMKDDFTDAVAAAVSKSENFLEYEGDLYLLTMGANDKERLIYSAEGGEMKYTGKNLGEEFLALVGENLKNGYFVENGEIYTIAPASGAYTVSVMSNRQTGYVSSTYVFDTYVPGQNLSDEFKVNALLNIYGEGKFSAAWRGLHRPAQRR